jgi:hypothetical protein
MMAGQMLYTTTERLPYALCRVRILSELINVTMVAA